MGGVAKHSRCFGDDRAEGLVAMVLFCCGGIFEEDLRWEPGPGVFVDIVEMHDEANCVALFKTAEALRGAFFF